MTFGIIGYGRFGKLWAQCLAPYGQVLIYDQKIRKLKNNSDFKNVSNVSLHQVVKSDLLFLLVPMSQMQNCCRRISRILKPETIVVDACSVKMKPAIQMKKYLPVNQTIIATHPLFGPDSVKHLGLAGRKIVVYPLRCSAAKQAAFENLLKKMRLEIIHATPRQHDQQMANSQALVHFIGRGLAALKLREQNISTPDYQSLMHINDMVNNDTWDLFFNMQRLNPYAKNMRQKLLRALLKLDQKIDETKVVPGDVGNADLRSLRRAINKIDRIIIEKIAQRLVFAEKIGLFKQKKHIRVIDKKREEQLQKFHNKLSKQFHINPAIIHKIFATIITASKKIQPSFSSSELRRASTSR